MTCTRVTAGSVCLAAADATAGQDAAMEPPRGMADADTHGDGTLQASNASSSIDAASPGDQSTGASQAADDGAVDALGREMRDAGDAGGCGCACSGPAQTCADGGCNSRLVLFGGNGIAAFLNDTWEWDGSQWLQRSPVQSPSARWSYALATLCGRATLFGGSLGFAGQYVNDQWEWDGNTWIQRAPLLSPSPRKNSSIAALNGNLVLFGGYSRPGNVTVVLDETWTWDGANWAQQHPSRSPPARAQAAIAALGGGVVLFGGDDMSGPALGDTWIWDGTTWTEIPPAPSPPPRYGAAAATLNGRVVLFGGFDSAKALDDTWTWDGKVWTQQNPVQSPVPRFQASAATFHDRILLFGGESLAQTFDETWVWNEVSWTQLAVAGPLARSGSSMTGL